MLDDSQYSVINTNIRRIKIDDIECIEKIVSNNCDLGISQEDLYLLFEKYIEEINNSDINLPEILHHKIEEDYIAFYCVEKGENILEKFNLNELIFGKGRVFLVNIINEIKKAVQCKLNLDPHIKNFVIKNDEISFVDFSPPYTEEYFTLRLSLAKKDEIAIIKKNFQFFKPQYLYHHFLGDFFNVDKNISHNLTKEIFNLMKNELNLKQSYEDFLSDSKKIRNLEDERIKRDIFLF
jgi:hypothetical protein